MKNKEFVSWYDLPKAVRDEIISHGKEFEEMRHNGTWYVGGVRIYMDAVYPTISMRTACVFYDSTMPRFRKLMDRGIKIQIRPVEFKTLQVDFMLPIIENNKC